MWPFRRARPERRTAAYTDALVGDWESAATAPGATVRGLAALEACASIYAQAFAGVGVQPAAAARALPASLRAMIGRALIRDGQAVFRIRVAAGRINLTPASHVSVIGNADPASWRYLLTEPGPSNTVTAEVPAAAVAHFRYATSPAAPWRGVAPMAAAKSTATLASNLEQRLGEEAGAAVGSILPVPTDGGDDSDADPLAPLKKDLAAAKGRQVLAETTAGGWGDGRSSAPPTDYVSRRFGANPPEALVELRDRATRDVARACGIPAVLLAERGDGTSARAGWQRFLTTTLAPLLESALGDECERKLDVRPMFDTAPLLADLQVRAQAVERLTKAGVTVEEARAVTGL